MSLARDLIDQAWHLSKHEPRRPRQASLRRAVSTAYYALFHALVEDGARQAAARGPPGLKTRMQRAFVHATMYEVCKKFAFGKIERLPPQAKSLVASPIEGEVDRSGNGVRRPAGCQAPRGL